MTNQVNQDELYYIQRVPSGYLGNSPVWWAIGGNGYTSYIQNAERFSLAGALSLVKDGRKYAMFKCNEVDARLHLVFDMQDFNKLGTGSPCDFTGGRYASKASDSEINLLKRRIQELEAEIANLHTVMMAAAVEITERWEAHCDEDGCGPANLVRRLENGYPEQYGYDAKTMVRMDKQIDELTASNNQLREALSKYVPKKAYKDNGKWFVKTKQTTGYVECEISEYADALDAIASNPEKSLAQHDNEVTAPYKKALEFAEYLAKSTEQFMIAINQLDAADQEEDEATVEIMQEKRGEHWRAVNSSIYEFRQRSDRALKATP